MGVQQYPVPTSQIVVSSGTVSVSNTVNTYQTNWGTDAISAGRIALSNDTSAKLLRTTTAGKSVVVHSVTLSVNHTSGATGDRLGLCFYYHTDGASTQQNKVIASNFLDKGTITVSFPNGGLKLAAGNNLYYFFDCYGNFTANCRVDVTYSEVTP